MKPSSYELRNFVLEVYSMRMLGLRMLYRSSRITFFFCVALARPSRLRPSLRKKPLRAHRVRAPRRRALSTISSAPKLSKGSGHLVASASRATVNVR